MQGNGRVRQFLRRGGQDDLAGCLARPQQHAVGAAFGVDVILMDDVVAALVAVEAPAVVTAQKGRIAVQAEGDLRVAQRADAALGVQHSHIHASKVIAVGMEATRRGVQRQLDSSGFASRLNAVAAKLHAAVAVADSLHMARLGHIHIGDGEDEGALRLVAAARERAVHIQLHPGDGVAADHIYGLVPRVALEQLVRLFPAAAVEGFGVVAVAVLRQRRVIPVAKDLDPRLDALHRAEHIERLLLHADGVHPAGHAAIL